MLNLRWLVVLVGAINRRIEVVPRKLEVIRITAEKRDLLLWRPDQANIRIFLVAVQMILGSAVQRDDVASQAAAAGIPPSRIRDRVLQDLQLNAIQNSADTRLKTEN